MDPFTFIGICTFIYLAVHTLILFMIDCDIRLKFAEMFGKGISKYSRCYLFLLCVNYDIQCTQTVNTRTYSVTVEGSVSY